MLEQLQVQNMISLRRDGQPCTTGNLPIEHSIERDELVVRKHDNEKLETNSCGAM